MATEQDIRIQQVTFLVMDVDGVLTDGRMIYDNNGNEHKCFDAQDGMGIAVWKHAGYKVALITAKQTKIVERRAQEYHVDGLYQNAIRKHDAFQHILQEFSLTPQQMCFIGDDLLDIPVLKKVGFAVAVANACEEAKRVAHYVTSREGGRGAVREVVEHILRTQGKWDCTVQNLVGI